MDGLFVHTGFKPGEGPINIDEARFKVFFICTDVDGKIHDFKVACRGQPCFRSGMMLTEIAIVVNYLDVVELVRVTASVLEVINGQTLSYEL